MEMDVVEPTFPSPKVITDDSQTVTKETAIASSNTDDSHSKSSTSSVDVSTVIATNTNANNESAIEEDNTVNAEVNENGIITDEVTDSTMTVSSLLPEAVTVFRETSSDITTFEESHHNDKEGNDLSGSEDEGTSSDDDSGEESWSSEDDIYENPYICEECDEEFYSYDSFEVHDCVKQYGCPICAKTFDTIGKLVVHTKIHFAARACNYQKSSPAKRFRLDIDIANSEPEKQRREATIIAPEDDEERPHRCHICGKAFKHNHKLSSHLRTHSELYKCLACGRGFSTKHNLKRHCKDVHDMDEYKYELVLLNTPMDLEGSDVQEGAKFDLKECLNSDSAVNEAYTITHREMSSTDPDTKPLKCPECDKGFASQTGRQRHMKNHHPDKVPPSAPPGRKPGKAKKESAKKDFYAVYGVIKDLISHVSGEKKYSLSISPLLSPVKGPELFTDEHSNHSNDSFSSLLELELNSDAASNMPRGLHRSPIDKPYTCPECGKSFASKQYLKKHIKTTHDENFDTNSPTFTSEHQCNICLRYFMSNIILAIHADIHTEEHREDAIAVNAVIGDLVLSVERRLNGSSYQNLRLKCEDCGRHFATKQSLKRHALSHGRILDFTNDPRFAKPEKPERPLQIPQPKDLGKSIASCDVVAGNLVAHDVTIATENNSIDTRSKSGPHLCDICARPFGTYSGLRRHRIMHTSDPLIVKTLLSDIVNKVVAEVDRPLNPPLTISNNPVTGVKFPCPECGKFLNSKKGLKQHLKLHEEKRLRRIAEGLPPEVFPNAHHNSSTSVAHTSVVPTSAAPTTGTPNPSDINLNIWQCEYCKKVFNNKHSLKRHTKIHLKALLNAQTPEQQQHQQRQLLLQQQQQQLQQQLNAPTPHTLNNPLNINPFSNLATAAGDLAEIKLEVDTDSNPDVTPFANGFMTNISGEEVGEKTSTVNGCHSSSESNTDVVNNPGSDVAGGASDSGTIEVYKCECCGKCFTTSDILATHALSHLQDTLASNGSTENMLSSRPLIKAEDIKTEDIEEPSTVSAVEPYDDIKSELNHVKVKDEPESVLSNGDCQSVDVVDHFPSASQPMKESIATTADLLSDTTPIETPAPSSKRDPSGTHCCPVCGKTFSTAAGLGRHANSHQGDPFPCEICGKEFVQFNRLTRHMKNHVKQFHCQICGKSFGENYTLKRHMKSHKDILGDSLSLATTESPDINADVVCIKDEGEV